MKRTHKNLIKSFLYGIGILWGFFYVFFVLIGFNGDFAELFVTGLAIICTLLYCTYTIVDAIKGN